jgi:8-oxo-dGTP pyrophosphatase MutT (NUDIX family)
MRTTQIECLVFRKKNNTLEFLLLKRISAKGGFWQPPGGGLESEDKSRLEAAFREILEEAGITKRDVIRVIEDVDVFTFDRHYLTGEPIPIMTEYVFGFEVKPNSSVSIRNNTPPEHDEFQWLPVEKALKVLKWKQNKVALRKLHHMLRREP